MAEIKKKEISNIETASFYLRDLLILDRMLLVYVLVSWVVGFLMSVGVTVKLWVTVEVWRDGGEAGYFKIGLFWGEVGLDDVPFVKFVYFFGGFDSDKRPFSHENIILKISREAH